MNELQVTAMLTIHEGKLDEFKHIAEKCMDSVRTKDTGTPSPELTRALEGLDVRVYSPFQSL